MVLTKQESQISSEHTLDDGCMLIPHKRSQEYLLVHHISLSNYDFGGTPVKFPAVFSMMHHDASWVSTGVPSLHLWQ